MKKIICESNTNVDIFKELVEKKARVVDSYNDEARLQNQVTGGFAQKTA